MAVGRRELLRNLGGLCVSLCFPPLEACGRDDGKLGTSVAGQTRTRFLHGVASGDPLEDAVILWTRVTPAPDEATLQVRWLLASDSGFQEIVAQGSVGANADRDYTLKIDASGLAADTTYYYRFETDDEESPIGRTRTTPSGDVERVRFAVVSCASYAHGYFHAYRGVAERLDLNAVIHLGDYIYEYGDGQYGNVRKYDPPHEILTLEDYRSRYAYYRSDANLRAVHQQHPMIAVWDDHEIANNAWTGGAQNHNPELGEGDFAARKAAATRAYLEWMPIRENSDGRYFRRFGFGSLIDLVMLDTRVWGRTMQIDDPNDPNLSAEDRELLGADQEDWLANTLQASRAHWRVIGQQVMVGPMPYFFNGDAWAGYPAARKRFLEILQANENCVVLTGDVHMSWACNLTENPHDPASFDRETGRGSVSVEFVTPAISSPGLGKNDAATVMATLDNEPHVEYAALWQRGYIVLDVDRERVQAAYHHYEAVESATNPGEKPGSVFAVYSGERHLRQELAAAPSVSVTAAAPGEA